MPMDLEITPTLKIPDAELRLSFARSSGPGGQNVNKVSSKAILHFAILTTPSLPPDVRARFVTAYGSRITNAGEIVIHSEEYRDQPKNIQACYDKLRDMVLAVLRPRKKLQQIRRLLRRHITQEQIRHERFLLRHRAFNFRGWNGHFLPIGFFQHYLGLASPHQQSRMHLATRRLHKVRNKLRLNRLRRLQNVFEQLRLIQLLSNQRQLRPQRLPLAADLMAILALHPRRLEKA